MIKSSIRLIRKNKETLFTLFNFGIGSIYWIALSFFMATADYGNMMTLQAAVTLVSTFLTFRTHDLVFFLYFQRGQSIVTAYHRGFLCELTAALAGCAVCGVVGLFLYPPSTAPFYMAPGLMAAGLLMGLGAAQGAAIAMLRFHKRGDYIARADLCCATAWGVACITLFALPTHSPLAMLLLGMIPNLLRTVALLILAHTLRKSLPLPEISEEARPHAPRWPNRQELVQISRFLTGSQITNFLKNGGVSIETMILAAFFNPTMVAMYRLAKATQGATSAAINVEYQRSYSALARSTSAAERSNILSRLNRSSLVISMLFYPVSMIFGLVYCHFKPAVDPMLFQFIILGTFVTFVPAAVQQGYFASLSLRGDHHSVNLAYVASIATLFIVSAFLLFVPYIAIFIAAIIASAMVRLFILMRQARE